MQYETTNPNYDVNASSQGSTYGGFGILTMVLIAMLVAYRNV